MTFKPEYFFSFLIGTLIVIGIAAAWGTCDEEQCKGLLSIVHTSSDSLRIVAAKTSCAQYLTP